MSAALPVAAAAVLDFWFGEIRDGFCVEDRSKLWFSAGPTQDRQIHGRFGGWVQEAADGRLQSWCESPRGRLAVIVLLDQFTRNIYRGTARAFAHDELALDLCLKGLEHGHDRRLAPVERSFFYLPLEHSECLEHQELCVARFQGMVDELPAADAARLRNSLQFAIRHRDIIRRFGRFPHRNGVLARDPTEAERRYLAEGGDTFGQETKP